MTHVFAGGGAVLAEQPAQSPGTLPIAGAASLIIVLLLGFLLWRAIEKKQAKPQHLIMAFIAGALLAGSMIGAVVQQTAASVGQGFATMLGTVAGTGGSNSGSNGTGTGGR